MITFYFWSVQSITITITEKTVIDCNRLRLTITITPCLAASGANQALPPNSTHLTSDILPQAHINPLLLLVTERIEPFMTVLLFTHNVVRHHFVAKTIVVLT